MSKVSPFLWFEKDAEEAVRFYVSLLPDSRVDRISTLPADSLSGPEGSVQVVEFTLAGQSWMAMSAGPLDPFDHAVSFMIHAKDQAEIDRIWDAILKNGGKEEQCGWIRDRWGLAWQIVPAGYFEMFASPDRAAAKRLAHAMMKMVKFDKASLERAFRGDWAVRLCAISQPKRYGWGRHGSFPGWIVAAFVSSARGRCHRSHGPGGADRPAAGAGGKLFQD